jgi:hypothetical protein
VIKRALKLGTIGLLAALVLGLSGAAWYAFSAPQVERLPLASDLIDATSVEGGELLARTSIKTDFGQLAPEFVAQARRGFCGVATSVVVINALLHPQPRLTQKTLFTPAASAVRSELAVSFGGVTLEQLAQLLEAHGLHVGVVHASESSLESFRDTARAALGERRVFLIVNYHRALLGQEGPGHISPVGAYDPQTDRVLVLDVAAYKYPYTWVPVAKLWSAMNTTDSDSGKTRGYLLVSAGDDQRAASADGHVQQSRVGDEPARQ